MMKKNSSLWHDDLKHSEWHLFKSRMTNKGSYEDAVDEDDEKLQNLESEWGDDVYDAVVTVVEEINEYNPGGKYVVFELWKSKEGRKAALEEIIVVFVETSGTKALFDLILIGFSTDNVLICVVGALANPSADEKYAKEVAPAGYVHGFVMLLQDYKFSAVQLKVVIQH